MKKLNAKYISVLIIVVMLASALLSACGFIMINASGIRFNAPEITMELGSEKEINSSVVEVTPTQAHNKNYSLSGGKDDSGKVIFEILSSTNRIVAKSIGSAKLTATTEYGNFTDSIIVTVKYATINELTINYVAEQKLAQDVIILPGETVNSIEFTSTVSPKDYSDPSTMVDWVFAKTGGEQALPITKKVNESYIVSPTEIGEYVVTGMVKDGYKTFTDWQNINVCAKIEGARATAEGALEQQENSYSTVLFTVNFENPINNPPPIIEWFVNNEVALVEQKQFSYYPKEAGVYDICVKINGEPVSFEGGQTVVRVIAKGSITPQNVKVDYDNCYPKVIVSWDEIAFNVGYSVSILDSNTGREIATNLNTNNNSAKPYFTKSSFDATSFLPADGIFKTTYTIKVMTLSDSDGVFTDSIYSKTAKTTKLPLGAKPYLSKKYYDGNKNYYLADFDNEFLDWFSYIIIFRPEKADDSGVNNYKIYANFNFGTSESLFNEAFKYTHFTGDFTYNSTSANKVVTLNMTFNVDGIPSKKTTHSANEDASWDSVRPHLNYDSEKARSASIILPIEKLQSVIVENSEELYYIAEKGYYPSQKQGSSAEKFYKYARRVLCYIITDDMTDVEKAHAIYDWIMWRVDYDHQVLNEKDFGESVKYESYYLDSVLTDTDFYSVCDGMSKAYSLMCNMEGIQCLRITGTVSNGGHAWNKVKIDNVWYIVDCTWGDMIMENAFEDGVKEFASHVFFLVSDAEVPEHKQDSYKNYPVSASSYNWYDTDYKYGDVAVDFYIDASVAYTAETKLLVKYMLDMAVSAPKSYYVGADNIANNKSETKYIAFDVKVNDQIADAFKSTIWNGSSNVLISAFSSYQKRLNSDYCYYYDNTIEGSLYLYIFIKLPI